MAADKKQQYDDKLASLIGGPANGGAGDVRIDELGSHVAPETGPSATQLADDLVQLFLKGVLPGSAVAEASSTHNEERDEVRRDWVQP
jgi:hypothetical protein